MFATDMPVKSDVVEEKRYNGLAQTVEKHDVTVLESVARNGTTSLMKCLAKRNNSYVHLSAHRLDDDQITGDVYLFDEAINAKFNTQYAEKMRNVVRDGKKMVLRTKPSQTDELLDFLGVDKTSVGKYELLPISLEHMKKIAGKYEINVSDDFLERIDQMKYIIEDGTGLPLNSMLRSCALDSVSSGRSEEETLAIYEKGLNKTIGSSDDPVIKEGFDNMDDI